MTFTTLYWLTFYTFIIFMGYLFTYKIKKKEPPKPENTPKVKTEEQWKKEIEGLKTSHSKAIDNKDAEIKALKAEIASLKARAKATITQAFN